MHRKNTLYKWVSYLFIWKGYYYVNTGRNEHRVKLKFISEQLYSTGSKSRNAKYDAGKYFCNNNLLQPSVNNYEDDFLMPDYLKMSNINANPYGALNQYQAQTQQQQVPVQQPQQEQQALINQPQALVNPQQQTTFTAQPQMPVDNSQLMNGSLQAIDKKYWYY